MTLYESSIYANAQCTRASQTADDLSPRERPPVAIVATHELTRQAIAALLAEAGLPVVATAPTLERAIDRARAGARRPGVLVAVRDSAELTTAGGVARFRRAFPGARSLLLDEGFDRVRMAAALTAGFDGYHLVEISAGALCAGIALLASGERLLPPQAVELLRSEALPPALGSPAFGKLTEREKDIVRSLARGLSDKAIARELSVSAATVSAHLRSVRRKTGAANRTQLALWATRGAT